MWPRAALLAVLAACLGATGCVRIPPAGPRLQAIVAPAVPKGTQVSAETLQAAAKVLQTRLCDVGWAEVKTDAGRILVALPAGRDSLLEESVRPGDLRFEAMPGNLDNAASPPDRVYWVDSRTRAHVPDADAIAAGFVILRGKDFEQNARVETGARGSKVFFEIRGDRQAEFRNFTRVQVGRWLAILLDDEFLEAVVIKAPLPGKGVIEGGLPLEEARRLVRCINSGPLPVPLAVLQKTGPAGAAR